MGFIREPAGVDFVIAPSPTITDDIAFISSCIRQHKTQIKVDENVNAKRNTKSKINVKQIG